MSEIKKNLKNCIYFFLNLASRFIKRQGLPILMYHSVDSNKVFFTVRPDLFRWQIDYLKKNNFRTLFLSEFLDSFLNRKEISAKTIVLTFDDGYEDFYQNVFPLLKINNFKATVFLAVNFIGQEMNNSSNFPLKILNWDQIIEMQKSGLVEFEPHGTNHLSLTQISLSEAEVEILNSKNEIEQRLGKICQIFAFPKGYYNEGVILILRESGFKGAVTIKEGLVTQSSSPFELKRNSIDSSVTKQQFLGKISYSVEIFNKIFKC